MTLAPFSEANAAACMSGMALTSSPLGAEFRAQLAARDPMHPLLRQVKKWSQAHCMAPRHAATCGLLGTGLWKHGPVASCDHALAAARADVVIC